MLLRPAMLAAIIMAAAAPALAERTLSADDYLDKLRGMWLGEILGNYAGRPYEGAYATRGGVPIETIGDFNSLEFEPGANVTTSYYYKGGMETAQILATLGPNPSLVSEIVRRVYTDIPAVLHAAAAHSVTAHLLKLEREGRARREGGASALADCWSAA